MTIDDRNQMSKLLAHVQAMAYQSKQVAMDGSNWRELLDELEEAAKLVMSINNALRKVGTHVYLVSDEPLPDDVAAYDNEEGASQDAWDRGMSGADVATMTPVENIRWATAPAGNYRFYIHNYLQRDRASNWYKAEIEVCGQVFSFEGMSGQTDWQTELASFRYQKGVVPTLTGSAAQRSGTAWNLQIGQFYDVTGIVKSPNLWGEQSATHVGDHTFFLIAGCRDTSEGKGRGFFNEILRPELREIRKTLEAYTANAPIAGCENATACGLGYSKDGDWGVTLRVSRGPVVALYKLDRWD